MMVPAVPRVESRTADVTAARALAATWTGFSSSLVLGSWDCSLTCPSVTTRPKATRTGEPVWRVTLVSTGSTALHGTCLDRPWTGCSRRRRLLIVLDTPY